MNILTPNTGYKLEIFLTNLINQLYNEEITPKIHYD